MSPSSQPGAARFTPLRAAGKRGCPREPLPPPPSWLWASARAPAPSLCSLPGPSRQPWAPRRPAQTPPWGRRFRSPCPGSRCWPRSAPAAQRCGWPGADGPSGSGEWEGGGGSQSLCGGCVHRGQCWATSVSWAPLRTQRDTPTQQAVQEAAGAPVTVPLSKDNVTLAEKGPRDEKALGEGPGLCGGGTGHVHLAGSAVTLSR